MIKNECTLTGWSFGPGAEAWHLVVRGIVFGHPNFKDGTCITSSNVIQFRRDSADADSGFVETQNTYYRLEGKKHG